MDRPAVSRKHGESLSTGSACLIPAKCLGPVTSPTDPIDVDALRAPVFET